MMKISRLFRTAVSAARQEALRDDRPQLSGCFEQWLVSVAEQEYRSISFSCRGTRNRESSIRCDLYSELASINGSGKLTVSGGGYGATLQEAFLEALKIFERKPIPRGLGSIP